MSAPPDPGAPPEKLSSWEEWSKAIKEADPLGKYDHTPAEVVEQARGAGQQAFETAENPFNPSNYDVGPPRSRSIFEDPAEMRELRRNLGARPDGTGPMDPVKLKEFQAALHPKDPLREHIDNELAAMAAGGAIADGGWEEVREREKAKVDEHRGFIKAHAEKNAGEVEVEGDGRSYRYEQTSKDGESEILVRFTLPKPATKKDVKALFKVQALRVVVGGEVLFDGRLYGKIFPDECTWSLVEQTETGAFSELQVLISLAEDVKWHDLGAALPDVPVALR